MVQESLWTELFLLQQLSVFEISESKQRFWNYMLHTKQAQSEEEIMRH